MIELTRSFPEIIFPPSWDNFLGNPGMNLLRKPLGNLRQALDAGKKIYPHSSRLFRAFELVQPEAVRVVILGQDPYHGPHQANGLAFAVDQSQDPPPSLRNIQKALENDRLACRSEGLESLMNGPVDWGRGDLEAWAGQGVLLMNDVLTVEDGCPGAHRSWGWSLWTEYVIHTLQSSRQGLVWMLWGKEAQRHHAGQLTPETSVHHLMLTAPHPSPLSAYRGFLNCRHFSKANRFLSSYL